MDHTMADGQSGRPGLARGRGEHRGRGRGRNGSSRGRGGIRKRVDASGDVVMDESSLKGRVSAKVSRGRGADRGRRGINRNRGGSRPVLKERPGQKESNPQKELKAAHSQETKNVKEKFKQVLAKRYDVSSKLLNLSALAQDPDLVEIGLLNLSSASAAKFFPALMVVCDQIFSNEEEKRAAIVSVSLANNGIDNVRSVSSLAQTFPDILNLDLSGNNFSEMKDIIGWRWRFRSLKELLLTNNPIVGNEPTLGEKMMTWYPNLEIFNGVRGIRTAETSQTDGSQTQVSQPQPSQVHAIQVQTPQEHTPQLQAPQVQSLEQQATQPQADVPSNEQKEALAHMLMERTGMTLQYTVMCLEGNAWDINQAYSNYQAIKPSLPPNAFTNGVPTDIPL